jgi:hypothetical protein
VKRYRSQRPETSEPKSRISLGWLTYDINIQQHVKHHPSLQAEELSPQSFPVGIIYQGRYKQIFLPGQCRQTFRCSVYLRLQPGQNPFVFMLVEVPLQRQLLQVFAYTRARAVSEHFEPALAHALGEVIAGVIGVGADEDGLRHLPVDLDSRR